VSYPWYQGGRASQQWGNTVRHASYGLLLPPPPTAEVATVEPEPVVVPVAPTNDTERTTSSMVMSVVCAVGG
jgi:hypothetical protein